MAKAKYYLFRLKSLDLKSVKGISSPLGNEEQMLGEKGAGQMDRQSQRRR